MSTQIHGHALVRVSERLQMSVEEVEELLNQERYVLLGREDSSPKVHKLFFSVLDGHWFVAVQDEVNMHVITIIPLAYHYKWCVSQDAMHQARELALKERPEKKSCIDVLKPSVWRVTACFETVRGTIRHVNLKSFPLSEYSSIRSLEEDSQVCEILDGLLKTKMREEDRRTSLLVRLGGNGVPEHLVLRALRVSQ